jgi:formate-dependent nitrite reductase membrane component NrfD
LKLPLISLFHYNNAICWFFFSLVFLFFRKKETKKLIYLKLIQDESASGTISTSLSAIFFDPDAHRPCALSKLRLSLRSNLSLGLTESSLMSLKKEEIALAERSRSQKR